MAKWDTITSNFPGPFATSDGVFPDSYGDGSTTSANHVTWTPLGYVGIISVLHDLIGTRVVIQLDPRILGDGYCGMTLKSSGNADMLGAYYYGSGPERLAGFYFGSGFGASNSNDTIEFEPPESLWLQFREDAGTVYVEWAEDGINFDLIHSDTASGDFLTALVTCKVQLEQGPFPGTLTSSVAFANFNLPPEGAADVEGTADGTWGSLTAAATGGVTHPGTVAQSWGSLTATATGTKTVSGAVAQSLGALAGSATVVPKGEVDQSWGALTATATGTPKHLGSVAQSWGALTAAATGTPKHLGSVSQSWGGLDGSSIVDTLVAPLAPYDEGTEVGVPTGTSLTTRGSLGSPTGSDTIDLIDPSGTYADSLGYAVDVWEAIDFTASMNIDPTTSGTPRLFRNCRFAFTGAATMLGGHNDTAGTVMTPLIILDHCTIDGSASSLRALNSGRVWLIDCHVEGVQVGWGSGFNGVASHCNIITDSATTGAAVYTQAVGGAVLWNNWLSSGVTANESPIRLYTEFNSLAAPTIIQWNGINGGDAGLYLRPSSGRTIADLVVTDNVFMGYATGPVQLEESGGTLTIDTWARNTIDTPGGVLVPNPIANDITGTAAATFGGLTATALGTPKHLGSVAQSWGGLTGSSSLIPNIPGVAAATWGALTATTLARRTSVGQTSTTFGGLTAAGLGLRTSVGQAEASITFAGTATAVGQLYGTAAGEFGQLEGAAVIGVSAYETFLTVTVVESEPWATFRERG